MPSVFWSWQSDAPQRETRTVIKDALVLALQRLNSSIEEAERPEAAISIDHDTKGLSGSPDIVTAILDKIDSASAFVADVTPIGIIKIGDKVRHVANPNVLIELGYAKKSLGLSRVIQVWNTAITSCDVGDLPFDMRGRRGPISFHLPEGATRVEFRDARDHLTEALVNALAIINFGSPSSWPDWKPANDRNPAIWFEEGALLTVNEDRGSGQKRFPSAPTQYARLLPSAWKKPSHPSHSCILGHTLGISWGRTRGGLLTYSGIASNSEFIDSPNGTIQFFDTGEVWAIDRFIVAKYREKTMFHGDDLFGGVVSFLSAQLKRMSDDGANFPIKVRLGASGLLGSHWPIPNPYFSEPTALEDQIEVETCLNDQSQDEIQRAVMKYWTATRDIFAMEPPNEGQIQAAMKFYGR